MNKTITQALTQAEALARARGVSLTPTRRRVLELVLGAPRPVGAYALLAALGTSKAMPATVYRALDFLINQRFIHRIESQNAYTACWHPGHPHRSQFLICDQCGTTVELSDPALPALLERMAADHDFTPNRQIVEIHGACHRCRHGETQTPPADDEQPEHKARSA